MALTRVSEVAAKSMRYKGEENKDEQEARLSEGCSANTQLGTSKATHPRGSVEGLSARRKFCLVLISCSFSANRCYAFSLP